MYEKLSLYIDGRFESGEASQPVINPATGEVLASLPRAGLADLDKALVAAQKGYSLWKTTSPLERSGLLRQVARLLAEKADFVASNISLDEGKPKAEALAEIKNSVELLEWNAEEARRIYGRIVPARSYDVSLEVHREAVGVCVAFSPWNFPLSQAVKKVAAALGAGCSMIIKGPEEAPSALMTLVRLFDEAGLPPGVLNAVWGEPAVISDYLISSPVVRMVSFTGSVPVGRRLAEIAGRNLKRLALELGGHAPVIVLDDADVDAVAAGLARAKVRNAGQVCVSPSRFYVQKGIYERFLEVFTKTISGIKIGFGWDEKTQMGPLANIRRLEAAAGLVEDARRLGATVLTGGARLHGPQYDGGFFFQPTVLAGLPPEALVLNQEPFCPVAPVVIFDEIQEAVSAANRLPYGLAAYVFTESLRNARHISRALEVGMVGINQLALSQAETPFGGVKDSGFGREGGRETFDDYLVTKFINRV